MKTYLTIEYAHAYGVSLNSARRLTDEEKPHYADWFQDYGFISLGDTIELPEVTWRDLPKRESDGSFLGCGNSAWIITQEEWDAYAQLDAARKESKANTEAAEKAAYEEKLAQRESEKVKRVSRLDSWDTTEEIITDEDGKTRQYTHTVKMDGKTYTFIERNAFDIGRVINPAYEISQGHRGGICVKDGGARWWMDFAGDENGWQLVRELEPEEAYCYSIVESYGAFAGSQIRM